MASEGMSPEKCERHARVFEIAAKMAMAEDADREDIRKTARETGMRTLMEDGLAKVAAGITTVEEIFRVVR